ncbi:radical SAM family heme chaperone HemW [Allorhizocola rhizosphaerae]|uniref:radical SAM family heme chaperone HemW n=1 Tax=Allorhizocola rhizosphaerae TaxID=1872709 RepID=UPI000E3B8757|nr:radical SAM family heme chaperone HemW [Allorhizocola rhizosphaerae]
MAAALPEGDPVPSDGALPSPALEGLGERGFGVYIHVPFCASRCGYCDFNTYTASELSFSAGDYVDAVLAEIKLASGILAHPVETVFFGGGTPTLLPTDQLARLLDAVRDTWGLAPGAEVTTEANPESVSPASLKALREHGFTRISLGMQSAAPGVLRILDRQHTPGRAIAAVEEARTAGFKNINLDLIYGTPGESAADFESSLELAIGSGADHVSAYSLIVEDGTRLAARIDRGEIAQPSDDVAADRYLAAEARLSAAGFEWYEVSNWARFEQARCRHNLLYWRGGDWWGFGPGAHSHVGGVRWWNVKHPRTYGQRLASGVSPGHGREILTASERRDEHVMLAMRLASGLPLDEIDVSKVEDGLLDVRGGRATLTLRGRLLADAVIRSLLT